MHAVGNAYDVCSRLYGALSSNETAPTWRSTSATTPNPMSTLASTWVSVSKMSLMMPLAVALSVTFSQVELTWLTVERVLVRRGESRKRPAPAVPLPLKKEMPRRSWGWKPPRAVRERLGRAAWKGRAVMLVLELGLG